MEAALPSAHAPSFMTGAAIWAVTGFALGSIPWGLLVLKLAGGPDPRTIGSGNIGATNVVRAGGKGLGLVTLILDAAKGFVPVMLAGDPAWAACAGAAAVLGHCYSPWLRFRGGKGVATFFGVSMVGSPWATLAFGVVWLGTFAVARVSAIASVTATLAATATAGIVALAIMDPPGIPGFVALAVAAMAVVVRHRSNFEKMRAERRARTAAENPA